MAGTLTPGLLDEKVDENGTCFKDAAASAGYGGKSHQVGGTCALQSLATKACSQAFA